MPRCGVVALLWLLVGCSPTPVGPTSHAVRGEAFGTSWTVKWVGKADDGLSAAIVGALEGVDRGMSTWRDDSELMAVRRGSGPVTVTADTFEVVKAGLQLANVTDGAFDPTVQPLVEFWGFHGTPRVSWPTEEEVAGVRASVGYTKVMPIRSLDGQLTINANGTALDLSAIAKGFAVDKVSEVLQDRGHDNHLVEIGGEVMARGTNGRGEGWALGVDSPVSGGAPGQTYAAIFELDDAAMATSGNYRSRVQIGDRDVGHTIDPRTGYPTETATLSATVIAPNCMIADGWATALMVLDVQEGIQLIEQTPELSAYLQVADGDGIREVSSSRLSRHVRKR